MKVSPLLAGVAGLTLIALTATTLYAQTTTGTSLVDKMKATVHTFTLAADLNAGQTGYESAPIAGKKTGNILTAGEWNRMLELVSEGGGGGAGSGWVDVPLTDTNPFDKACEYKFTINTNGDNASIGGTNPVFYAAAVDPFAITYISHLSATSHILASSKNVFRSNGTPVYTVTKIEKLCGGGGGGSAIPACPSGFVAIGSYCIEPTMSSTGKTWYEAAVACTDKGAQLCHWSEWSAACLKGKLTDVTFGASGKYEWIDDYSIGNQGIADPIVHSDCKYLSRQADTTAAANTGYRCCTSQK